ncbi:TIGR02117 family protein [Eikenella sp. Marseille-P7795]|uniref:TIGR02117 family protein n=1 Tax=Eikenella sp. Marseille-P7795 TaxID=2866577 RepID=UPI001CE3C68D|nr:TIGR02117 family protein [Eikenella sp. Marseille-P7795]
MPTLRRLIRRSLLSLAALLLLYGAAVWLLPHIKSPGHAEGEPEITVWLLSNGVHTDIVVPAVSSEADWRAVFPAEHTRSQEYTPWLAIGLGDKNFYLTTPTWADLRPGTALKAATGLSSNAVHATYLHSLEGCARCAPIRISRPQYRRLVAYIRQSLQWHNGRTRPIPTHLVYGDHDAFYEATGSYSLFYTCNTWTNNALKTMGSDAALWTITEQGIFLHHPPQDTPPP